MTPPPAFTATLSRNATAPSLSALAQRILVQLRAMWLRIEGLREGTAMQGRRPWSPATSHLDRTLLRLGRVLWRTGHRVEEIVVGPSGEVSFLTRSSVTLKLSGVVLVEELSASLATLSSHVNPNCTPCPPPLHRRTRRGTRRLYIWTDMYLYIASNPAHF